MCDHTHPEIEELASVVMGPRKTDLEGGGRREEEGLAWQVRSLYTASLNGGIRAKVSLPWGRISVALIGSVGTIVAAILGS